jgi:hypothetical protein
MSLLFAVQAGMGVNDLPFAWLRGGAYSYFRFDARVETLRGCAPVSCHGESIGLRPWRRRR